MVDIARAVEQLQTSPELASAMMGLVGGAIGEELMAARAEIERLRAALAPLARQADFYKPEVPHYETVPVHMQYLRAARAAWGDAPLPSIEELIQETPANAHRITRAT